MSKLKIAINKGDKLRTQIEWIYEILKRNRIDPKEVEVARDWNNVKTVFFIKGKPYVIESNDYILRFVPYNKTYRHINDKKIKSFYTKYFKPKQGGQDV